MVPQVKESIYKVMTSFSRSAVCSIYRPYRLVHTETNTRCVFFYLFCALFTIFMIIIIIIIIHNNIIIIIVIIIIIATITRQRRQEVLRSVVFVCSVVRVFVTVFVNLCWG